MIAFLIQPLYSTQRLSGHNYSLTRRAFVSDSKAAPHDVDRDSMNRAKASPHVFLPVVISNHWSVLIAHLEDESARFFSADALKFIKTRSFKLKSSLTHQIVYETA